MGGIGVISVNDLYLFCNRIASVLWSHLPCFAPTLPIPFFHCAAAVWFRSCTDRLSLLFWYTLAPPQMKKGRWLEPDHWDLNPGFAIDLLCDPKQIIEPLCASVFSVCNGNDNLVGLVRRFSELNCSKLLELWLVHGKRYMNINNINLPRTLTCN